MFRVMLYSQWKWSRLIVALGSIAAFALPIVSVQGAARADSNPLRAGELMQAVTAWGAVYLALAVLVAYAVFFAVSAGSSRTLGIMLGLIGGVVLVQIIAGVANLDLDLFGKLQIVVLNWPGPLAIFSGRWMLIDV